MSYGLFKNNKRFKSAYIGVLMLLLLIMISGCKAKDNQDETKGEPQSTEITTSVQQTYAEESNHNTIKKWRAEVVLDPKNEDNKGYDRKYPIDASLNNKDGYINQTTILVETKDPIDELYSDDYWKGGVLLSNGQHDIMVALFDSNKKNHLTINFDKGIIQIDGKGFTIDTQEYLKQESLVNKWTIKFSSATIMNVNWDDDFIEILAHLSITRDISDEYYKTLVLRYDGKNLYQLGAFPYFYETCNSDRYPFFEPENGVIKIAQSINLIEKTMTYFEKIALFENELYRVDQEIYELAPLVKLEGKRNQTKTVIELVLYEECDLESRQTCFSPEQIEFTYTDLKEWIKVKGLERKKEGWLYIPRLNSAKAFAGLDD